MAKKLDNEITSPLEKYDELPDSTRVWLEQLREEDLNKLKSAVEFYSTLNTVGRFNVRVLGFLAALFIGAVTLITSYKTLLGWFRNGN